MFPHRWQHLGCSQQLPTHSVASRTASYPLGWDSKHAGVRDNSGLFPAHSPLPTVLCAWSKLKPVLMGEFPPYLYLHPMPRHVLMPSRPEERFSALASWALCLGFESCLPQAAPDSISSLAGVLAFCLTLSSSLIAHLSAKIFSLWLMSAGRFLCII